MVYFSKWKTTIVLGIVLVGLVVAAPNAFKKEITERLPDWLPHQQVNLGLDLQGGSHLLLEVKVSSVVHERLESIVDSIRVVLRKNKIRYTGLGVRNDFVTFLLRNRDKLEKAQKLVTGVDKNLEIIIESNRISVGFNEQALRTIKSSARN